MTGKRNKWKSERKLQSYLTEGNGKGSHGKDLEMETWKILDGKTKMEKEGNENASRIIVSEISAAKTGKRKTVKTSKEPSWKVLY